MRTRYPLDQPPKITRRDVDKWLSHVETEIGDILRESLEHERQALSAYTDLLNQVEGRSVLLEEYARQLISEEEMHQGEVLKMLRSPQETEHAFITRGKDDRAEI